MKLKKALAITLCTVLALTLLAACSNNSGTTPDGTTPSGTTPSGTTPGGSDTDGGLTFGWSVYDLSNPFFVPMDEGVKAKAAELGIALL
ncbi:MAG: hypothetical protein LBU32_17860, partial [Clostridiales bacterium]|nr:hypothetical protein [Clostridiales bacterium]